MLAFSFGCARQCWRFHLGVPEFETTQRERQVEGIAKTKPHGGKGNIFSIVLYPSSPDHLKRRGYLR
jgi:hypothetical protein